MGSIFVPLVYQAFNLYENLNVLKEFKERPLRKLNVIFIVVGIVFAIAGIWMEVVYAYIEVCGLFKIVFKNGNRISLEINSQQHQLQLGSRVY